MLIVSSVGDNAAGSQGPFLDTPLLVSEGGKQFFIIC